MMHSTAECATCTACTVKHYNGLQTFRNVSAMHCNAPQRSGSLHNVYTMHRNALQYGPQAFRNVPQMFRNVPQRAQCTASSTYMVLSPPTSQNTDTDGQTTCDSNTSLCTVVHRAVKTKSLLSGLWLNTISSNY